MELMIVITVLCISLSLLLTPAWSASLQIHQVQRYHVKVNNEVHDNKLSTLPRKLRFTAEVTVKGHGIEDTMRHNYKLKEDVPAAEMLFVPAWKSKIGGAVAASSYSSSLSNKDQGVEHGIGSTKNMAAGTRQQWLEGGDTSQYFTMDYSHVKRRRPIHNKSVPVAP